MCCQVTLATVLKGIGQEELPVERTWRLNERHYGGLTGLNKAETAAKHGEEQVKDKDREISEEFLQISSRRLRSGDAALTFLPLPWERITSSMTSSGQKQDGRLRYEDSVI